MQDDVIESDLWLLYKGSDAQAAEAIRRLWIRGERIVKGYLIRKGALHPEDITQGVLIKVWERRKQFEPHGVGAWISYILTIAHRDWIDSAKKEDRETQMPEGVEFSDEDIRIIELLISAESEKRLNQAADEYWLGVKTDGPAKWKIVAIQMFFSGIKPEKIRKILGGRIPSIASDFDDWLADPALLRAAIFYSLYRGNLRLAGFILRPENPLKPADVQDLVTQINGGDQGEPPDGWTWEETHVILLRFRYGLLHEKIAQMKSDLEPGCLDTIVNKCLARLPFRSVALKVKRGLDELSQGKQMNNAGLWRRLVFEYRVFDELPHKQILERVVPAAEVAGEKVSDARLNGWLSSGRIYKDLAKFIRKGGAPC